MNVQTMGLTGSEFAHLKGKRLLEGNDIARVEELSYVAHIQTELVSEPFWATEIQDIVENKCVTYTPEEIQNGEFLGLRIKARADELELSFGSVGQEDSAFTVRFQKETDAQGFQVLGELIRSENVSALSA